MYIASDFHSLNHTVLRIHALPHNTHLNNLILDALLLYCSCSDSSNKHNRITCPYGGDNLIQSSSLPLHLSNFPELRNIYMGITIIPIASLEVDIRMLTRSKAAYHGRT